MQLNQPKEANIIKLVVDGQEIAVVVDFKYLGLHVDSTENVVNIRIALAWVAFAKLKPLLRASRIEFNIRLLMRHAYESCFMYANLGFSQSHLRKS